MGTGTSRGRQETPRTKKRMDCRQGVPQGDRKEASEPRGPLPPGTLLDSDLKKERQVCGCRFVQSHVNNRDIHTMPFGECTLIFYTPLKLSFS